MTMTCQSNNLLAWFFSSNLGSTWFISGYQAKINTHLEWGGGGIKLYGTFGETQTAFVSHSPSCLTAQSIPNMMELAAQRPNHASSILGFMWDCHGLHSSHHSANHPRASNEHPYCESWSFGRLIIWPTDWLWQVINDEYTGTEGPNHLANLAVCNDGWAEWGIGGMALEWLLWSVHWKKRDCPIY